MDKNRIELLGRDPEYLLRMQEKTLEAKSTADRALQDIAAHEKVCTERYGNIEKSFTRIDNHIPVIYAKLDKITTIVYVGVGIWIGVPGVVGMVYGFYKLMGH